eukprot:1825848-Amphidinium_carterae.2
MAVALKDLSSVSSHRLCYQQQQLHDCCLSSSHGTEKGNLKRTASAAATQVQGIFRYLTVTFIASCGYSFVRRFVVSQHGLKRSKRMQPQLFVEVRMEPDATEERLFAESVDTGFSRFVSERISPFSSVTVTQVEFILTELRGQSAEVNAAEFMVTITD